MNVYFDTEFTSLSKDGQLISLGMISEDGYTFYAEFNDYDESNLSDWVKSNVISNLEFNEFPMYLHRGIPDHKDIRFKGSKEDVKKWLAKWLKHRGDNIQLVSDVCHYDFVFFIDLFGTAFDLPENVSPVCIDINQMIAKYKHVSDRKAFDISRESLVPASVDIQGMKHNALYDAITIKYIYNMISKR